MSGMSRRDLLRGRFFGRGKAEVTSEVAEEVVAAPKCEADSSEETTAAAPPERPLPLPPWEQPNRPPQAPSPIAQVAPWEPTKSDVGADGVAINARAKALRTSRFAPGRTMTFSIQTNLCLAWRNTPCSVCRERCQVPNAITVSEGKPSIDADHCTGCGDCVAVCPAPIMAIRMNIPPRPTTP